MGLFGTRPPCERSPIDRDEALSPMVDGAAAGPLADHVAACERCQAALQQLRADRAALGGLGDVPGSAPDEAELRRVLAAVSLDRAARRPPVWMAWAGAAAAIVVACGFGARQLLILRARAVDDAAILAGADAAFRRAERQYTEAVAMLRAQLDKRGAVDDELAAGAKGLASAREQAAKLARDKRGDPEREALLREALRAEVRYYEDALMRSGVAPVERTEP
jgi:hypothetical protein